MNNARCRHFHFARDTAEGGTLPSIRPLAVCKFTKFAQRLHDEHAEATYILTQTVRYGLLNAVDERSTEPGMSKKVEELLRDARSVEMTAEEREAQRISFVYGNTAFENERITRELVDRVADKMKQTDKK